MGTLTSHVEDDIWVRTVNRSAVGGVQRAAIALAGRLGFAPARVDRLAVAVAEAVANLVAHAVDGVVLLRPHPEAASAVELIAIDNGPGIADLARAMSDGYSTADTLGIGMGAIARMSSGFDVHSMPGRGTVLVAYFTADDARRPALRISGLRRPMGEETVCGDSFAFVDAADAAVAVLCDGLGHGRLAARASREAVRIFLESPFLPPVDILRRIHDGLGGTRGGAVAVARIGHRVASFAGLGNVSGWITHAESRQAMISQPGIAGHHGGRPRQYEYPLAPHDMVVLHSDGLTDRWDPATFPGLFAHSPSVIGATLLRDAGTRRDDACVLVVRQRR